MNSSATVPARESTDEAYQASKQSYEKAIGLCAGYEESSLPVYNYDAHHASSAGLYAAEKVKPFRPMLEKLPDYDATHVDTMATAAEALGFVQFEINARVAARGDISAHAAEGYEIRALLLATADAWVKAGAFPAAIVDRIRAGSGYQDLVDDLGSLSSLYRGTPQTISAPVTRTHINRASELVMELKKDFFQRDESDPVLDQLIKNRRRIAYLLNQAHHQVYRGMSFLRDAQGDVDQLVPSLYAPAVRSKAARQAEPNQPAPVPQRKPEVPSTNPLDKPFDDLKD